MYKQNQRKTWILVLGSKTKINFENYLESDVGGKPTALDKFIKNG
jgi:hypothetical protein